MNDRPPSFESELRGVSFRPIEAKVIVKDLEEGDALMIEREPSNEYDPQAIRVTDKDSEIHIGYVAKEVACDLAPWMDSGWFFTCQVNGRMSASKVLLLIDPIFSEEAMETVSVEAPTD